MDEPLAFVGAHLFQVSVARVFVVFNFPKHMCRKILLCEIEDSMKELCGEPFDAQPEHAQTCCTVEATCGHYAVLRSIVDGIKLADASVTTKPRGLTTTASRPTDILTIAAVPGRSAVFDVCVASPNSSIAQGDAAELKCGEWGDEQRCGTCLWHAANALSCLRSYTSWWKVGARAPSPQAALKKVDLPS